MISRRRVALGCAVGGLAAVVARPAGAFTAEEVPVRSGLGFALANRCGGDAAHARVEADLLAALAGRHAAPGTTATATCPLCGCPVTVTSPGG